MTLLDMINSVVGEVPAGWEFVPYLLASASFIVVLGCVISIIKLPSRFIKGWRK